MAASQAQKEITHNEALTLIDAAIHLAVIADDVTIPPAAAEPGGWWIVAPSANGDWEGKDGNIAVMTSGGWRFIEPFEGIEAWMDGHRRLYREGQWQGCPGISEPVGGTTIDSEARSVMITILDTLKAAGLVTNP